MLSVLLKEKLYDRNSHVGFYGWKIYDQQVIGFGRAFGEMIHFPLSEQQLAAVVKELGVIHLSRQTLELKMRKGISKQMHIQPLSVHALSQPAIGRSLESGSAMVQLYMLRELYFIHSS